MKVKWQWVVTLVSLMALAGPLWAEGPAAQVGSFNQPSTPVASEKLKASIDQRVFEAPQKPWSVPPVPMEVSGEGIALFYLVPWERVAGLMPSGLKPFPGPDKIWFRVDCLNWKKLTVKVNDDLKKVKPFLELDYRFMVTKDGQLGSYPIRLQMNELHAVLWARAHGSYPAFKINVAYANFSPYIHIFQFRNDELATAVVEANPLEGLSSNLNDLFNRKADADLWAAGGLDFVVNAETGEIKTLKRAFSASVKSAAVETLLLRDPRKWGLLTAEEIKNPDKVLILDSINGRWLGQ